MHHKNWTLSQSSLQERKAVRFLNSDHEQIFVQPFGITNGKVM